MNKYLAFVGRLFEPSLRLTNRIMYKHRMNLNYPQFVGLMLSRVCDGYCLFCPISGVTVHSESKFMTPEIAKKVVDELSARDFRGFINIGENGDGLLNPHFHKIVEYISDNLNADLIFFSNANRMNEKTSRFLLDIGLSKFFVDIDGATEETYEFMKRNLKFEDIKNNLRTFIKIRNELESDCEINIVVASPRRYMELRKGKTDIPYDVDEIVKYWNPFLRKSDEITEIQYFYNWAHPTNKMRTKACPILSQFFYKIYISTNGNAYGCCLDYKTQMTFGNVMNKSIDKIWNGVLRKQTIKNIVNRDYKKIGEPCLHCSEKNDYLRSYLNFLKYTYMRRVEK